LRNELRDFGSLGKLLEAAPILKTGNVVVYR
jgi:hypothetical protein